MKRIMLTVAYDGTAYNGWQVQPNGITIEGELNKALRELLGEDISVIGASRTDAGVHALCNMAVFDTENRILPKKIAPALNARLPEDIRVQRSIEVEPDFHPRRCNTKRLMNTGFIWEDMKIPSAGSMRISSMFPWM